ncbi:tRNA (guanine-N(7)-)-methyltransferase non-catalytic subunit TRM82 [Canna indica]|uniref:tRNA (guanine-N(7)-)-methyltransferase non-catalytic subunit n=1 Tax=Canna indica TaxID=4628 RepID=A0AAQ3K709_9LILI|nr:tRNA (guanine-N(7)-)-methyltransferase non-catalytic subunit TRM82 [Canna indica]
MEETAEFVSNAGEDSASVAAVTMDVDNGLIEDDKSKDAEVAPALIAVHPFEKSVAVAVGFELRLFDLEGNCSVSLVDDSGGPSHSDAIRAIKFGANGRLFASAGDDKLVKIWATNPWHCIRTVSAEKRVSAVAISHNGHYVAFADKFGLVWLIGLEGDNAKQSNNDKKAVMILGHYCSIITRLEFSPDDRFIASADRDFKIRVTVFPKQSLKGAHEIQSFCLGHTDFVSCLAFAYPSGCANGYLLSGSGDSTVRLWDFISGVLLATCEVGAKVGSLEPNGTEDAQSPISDLCASSDGSIIAVALQYSNRVALLSCDFSNGNLSVAKVVTLEENYFPTSLGSSSLSKCLWMVMGASNLPMPGSAQLPTRLRIISGLRKDPSDYHCHDPIILEDNEVPGGQKLLSELQGSLDVTKEEAALAAAAAAVKASMRNMMIKKEYTLERREMRKKNRNDRKIK